MAIIAHHKSGLSTFPLSTKASYSGGSAWWATIGSLSVPHACRCVPPEGEANVDTRLQSGDHKYTLLGRHLLRRSRGSYTLAPLMEAPPSFLAAPNPWYVAWTPVAIGDLAHHPMWMQKENPRNPWKQSTSAASLDR
jgi:hypothetical protein